MKLCKCGCGNYVKLSYKRGHGRKGRTNSPEHNLAIIRANSGKKLSENTREKMSRSNKGRVVSEATRIKMSITAKERGVGKWMKGKKFNSDITEKMSRSNKGRVVSEATRIKISIANSGENNGMYGKHISPEAKAKISQASKEMWKNEYYRNLFITKNRENNSARKGALKTAIKLKAMGFSDTVPEIQMSKILSEANFVFIHSYPVEDIFHCYLADFYLDKYNLVIEVDGKYWHNYPDGRQLDKIRNEELQKAGYKILRFWEGEFNKEIVVKEILKFNEDHL